MILQVIIAFLLSANTTAHDFKMSVCEITYVEEQTHLQVKFYLFQDDLKEALYGDPLAPELKPDAVNDYILGKIKMTMNGQPIALSFLEMKEREDQVQVVFYSQKMTLPPAPEILISNHLLLEKFKPQTNMVYLTLPGRSKITQIMNGGKTEVGIGW